MDNGPGIPDQELETINQGEETPLQHGSGLGLWIVYWTVSLYGGEVTFVNNSPRGAAVILSLPRVSTDSSVQATPVEHN
ncbi:ATP-binding protein [Halomicroarcula sp. GCM10025709]|uniref:ATP-binding protein n=1 Tax=Halomicroarcula sp. GCM10025709 TaxID=3252669 RepID=UPI00360E90B6